MGVDHQAEVDQLMADYRRSREQLANVQRGLASVRESATSHDQLVTATVGARGTLIDLVIDDSAYRRLRPSELAETIVRTTEVAAAAAAAKMHDHLAVVLPKGADPEALLNGRGDLTDEEIGIEQPTGRHTRPSREDDSFEHRTWLYEGDRA